MAKEEQHIFSARTTGDGLKQLNELKKKRGVGWDDLVIDAVCEKYGLDKATNQPPTEEQTTEAEPADVSKTQAEKQGKVGDRRGKRKGAK